MNKQNKETSILNTAINIKDCARRFWRGGKEVREHPRKRIVLLGYCGLVMLAYLLRRPIVTAATVPALIEPALVVYPLMLSVIAAGVLLLWLYVAAGNPLRIENALRQTGFVVEGTKEPPYLVRQYPDTRNPEITVMEFASQIPLLEYENRQTAIESALNITIAKIVQGARNDRILLFTLPGTARLPDCITWDDSLLCTDGPKLVLGQSLLGMETVDLSIRYHILIGGETGSGKTILLKNLLHQCIMKGYRVFIADFKRGVDFGRGFKEKCTFATNASDVLEMAQKLVDEIERRLVVLEAAGCANIDDYNRQSREGMPRLIFACDEIAQLAKKGNNPEQKQQYALIREHVESITQLGRAAGVHAILATQRADANVVVGQIKNNLSLRVCGRADAILSEITIGNRDAAEQIARDAQGRFMTENGVLFQGFWFEERQ